MQPVDARKRLQSLTTFGCDIVKKQAVTLTDRGIDPAKFTRVVKEAIMRHPDIYQADKASFGRAVQACCRDGLVPDGYQAAMFVKRNGEVDYMPMVGGYQLAAHRALGVRPIVGSVREKDVWNLELVPGKPVSFSHKPQLGEEDRGPVIFSYCWVRMPDGTEQFRFLDRSELAAAKASSKSRDKALWTKFPSRAAEKSVTNSLLRFLRYEWMGAEDSDQLSTILANDEGVFQNEETVEVEVEEVEEVKVGKMGDPGPMKPEQEGPSPGPSMEVETPPPPPPSPPPPPPPAPRKSAEPAKTSGAVGDVDLPF